MGGADKNLKIKGEVIKTIQKYCKKVILLPGTGTNKLIRSYLPDGKAGKLQAKGWKQVKTLSEAVTLAHNLAKRGDVILLSPGFASFGPPPGGFRNEYDRGAQFVRLIKKLK